MHFSKEELQQFEENTEFTIICESPLEIEHKEDGSTANGICAEYIIDGYFSVI